MSDIRTAAPFTSVPNGSAHRLPGSGMDRKIEKKLWTPRNIGIAAGGALLLILIVYGLFFQDTSRRLNIDGDRLTVATVQEGTFQEYIPVSGTVLPIRTILLDAVVGGQVEQRLVEEGAFVEAGQPLLRLSNNQLTMNMMSSEAQLTEQINNIRNTRLMLDQNSLNLAQQLTQLDYEITRLRRDHERNQQLLERQVISREQYDRTRDELEYQRRRRELTLQSFRADSLSRAVQLEQMESSLGRLHRHLGLVQANMEHLLVRAPVSGQLSALNAEIGELKNQGERLGQIDILDGFRVRVAVDEHYIARVAAGQTGEAQIAGQNYTLEIKRVYPEVRAGRFELDMEFAGAPPADIRRGQTLRIRLELGDSAQALLLPRGGFFQQTGGNWVYVLDGETAVRRPIQIGRQNPQFFEVLDGLRPGERVITSSYETFGDADKLVIR